MHQRVQPKYIHDHLGPVFKPGIASMTLRHIPVYGTVRIILTPGCTCTYAHDGVREFNIFDIKSDPSLRVILDAIGKT